MASYSLDDIRAAAEKKYGSTDITVGDTVVELLNPLRMPKDKRTALAGMQERLDNSEDSGEDQEDILRDAIRMVARTETQAHILLGAIGDDLATLAQIFETYTSAQEAGEA